MPLAIFIGIQEGNDRFPDMALFNLLEPIYDALGNVKHPVGSTVTLNTLIKA